MAPAARMAMTRRVHPLVSLNPYQGNWTIKVRVTNKGTMRTYRNARGEGCVFNVELTDEDVSKRLICFCLHCSNALQLYMWLGDSHFCLKFVHSNVGNTNPSNNV